MSEVRFILVHFVSLYRVPKSTTLFSDSQIETSLNSSGRTKEVRHDKSDRAAG